MLLLQIVILLNVNDFILEGSLYFAIIFKLQDEDKNLLI